MKKFFYAVHNGKTPGVYNSWTECQANTNGVNGARFKKFTDKKIADYFVNTGISLQTVIKPVIAKPETAYIQHESDVIYMYTDGSCIHNGKKNAYGGIGVYFGENDTRNISLPFNNKPTNQRAELYAVIKGLKTIQADLHAKTVYVYTDSDYLIKCMTNYVKTWVKNDWHKKDGTIIANKEYICELYNLIKNNNVIFKHIASHTGKTDIHSIGNENADRLAVSGANKIHQKN